MSSGYITIDGIIYHVPLVGLDESADFLDKYAERTVDGALHRELIGVYFNQQLKFGAPTNAIQKAAMTALWGKLTEPLEFHTVTVPNLDGVDYTFTAYFSNVRRSLLKYQATKTFWKNFTVNFIAQVPARI